MMSRGLFAVALAAVLAFAPCPLLAQDAASEPSQRGPSDPAELETFVDGLMFGALEEFNTAGGVVVVVRDGEVFFAKGYGFSDWEAREPVDPETTLFRIGSVSKLFVWTSVMQMVEEGLLDLDTDINEYMDFEIPPTFEDPVTLADIMGHAGGFEDYVIELFGDEPEDVRPLGEILAEQRPARVRPAGDISAYSNHATGMAAYMVERAAETEWKEFTERSILEPLGMEYTTFRQPLPDHLEPHMSKGYSYGGGRFREQDFEYVPLAPVGAAAASANDMARFMVAHLQMGQYGDQRILSDETARLMQSVHHRMDPAVNGIAHGFADLSQRGVRIIGHGGDTRMFHTGLWLFPDLDMGVFASFNSREGGGARGRLFAGFMDRYFPVEEADLTSPDGFRERAKRVSGEYRSTRYSHTTVVKHNALNTQTVTVTDRGTLRALGLDWFEVAPLTYQEEYGTRKLVFREDADGNVTHFFLGNSPHGSFERVPLNERPGLHYPLLFLIVSAIVLTLVSPFVGWAIRRWHGVMPIDMVRVSVGARRASWLAALLLGVGFVMFFGTVIGGGLGLRVPPSLPLTLLLPFLAIVPTLAMVLFTVRMWRKKEGRPTVRVLYSITTVLFCILYWQMHMWNVLGWQY